MLKSLQPDYGVICSSIEQRKFLEQNLLISSSSS